MTLAHFSLKNFRNIAAESLEPSTRFNIFIGDNAQGKTNFLEAIYFLSTLKSFRHADRTELIQNGSDFAKLTAQIRHEEQDSSLEINLSESARTATLNHKPAKSAANLHRILPTLLFEPRHIYLFRDSPSERRRDLNRSVFLIFPETAGWLSEYEKIIAQKNRLLKERGNPELIAVWNDRLADVGSKIWLSRREFFRQINPLLPLEYSPISGEAATFQIHYAPSQKIFDPQTEINLTTLSKVFRERLDEIFPDEQIRRESILGPHRDDYAGMIGDRNLATHGSQGENRSAIIALKLSLLKLFREHHGRSPIFLLDDVASELDIGRCTRLFNHLRESHVQTFLTTPSLESLTPDFKENAKIYHVDSGKIK